MTTTHSLTINDSSKIQFADLSPDVVSFLSENVSPEDRLAVAELIQTTQQALGRASEALARIFLSFEASQVPGLAEEFLAFLRSKGLSKQRLSRIRIAARVRAELSRSSRLDLEPVRHHLLALGDELLDVYQRLPEAAKEKAHAIIQIEGRISRQQLRDLLSANQSPATQKQLPGRMRASSSPEPGSVSGQSAASFEAAPVPGRCPAASFEPEQTTEPVSQAVSEPVASFVSPVSPAPVSVEAAPVSAASSDSEAVSDSVFESAAAPVSEADSEREASFVPEASSVSQPVQVLPPIRGLKDIRDRIRSVGLNSYQILMAALDVLENREVNIFQRHTNEQLGRMSSIIDTIDREYRHHMR